jgi:hypothetical protein
MRCHRSDSRLHFAHCVSPVPSYSRLYTLRMLHVMCSTESEDQRRCKLPPGNAPTLPPSLSFSFSVSLPPSLPPFLPPFLSLQPVEYRVCVAPSDVVFMISCCDCIYALTPMIADLAAPSPTAILCYGSLL